MFKFRSRGSVSPSTDPTRRRRTSVLAAASRPVMEKLEERRMFSFSASARPADRHVRHRRWPPPTSTATGWPTSSPSAASAAAGVAAVQLNHGDGTYAAPITRADQQQPRRGAGRRLRRRRPLRHRHPRLLLHRRADELQGQRRRHVPAAHAVHRRDPADLDQRGRRQRRRPPRPGRRQPLLQLRQRLQEQRPGHARARRSITSPAAAPRRWPSGTSTTTARPTSSRPTRASTGSITLHLGNGDGTFQARPQHAGHRRPVRHRHRRLQRRRQPRRRGGQLVRGQHHLGACTATATAPSSAAGDGDRQPAAGHPEGRLQRRRQDRPGRADRQRLRGRAEQRRRHVRRRRRRSTPPAATTWSSPTSTTTASPTSPSAPPPATSRSTPTTWARSTTRRTSPP